MHHRGFYQGKGVAILLAVIALSGCDDDKRLVQLSEEAANRQAEQNRQIAHQSQQTAEATKELVSADAQARAELTALQQNLRSDQAELGKKRDALEIERQQIASERKWDRLLAPALTDLGVFAVISVSLAFCGYLLIGLRREQSPEAAVEELLIEELVADHPRLLPPRTSAPVLDYRSPPELGHPGEESTVLKT